jgi:hypothetical protein
MTLQSKHLKTATGALLRCRACRNLPTQWQVATSFLPLLLDHPARIEVGRGDE